MATTELPGSYVEERYKEALKYTREEVRNYWLNYAFLQGNQWLYWNPYDNRIDTRPEEVDRLQATINRMRANTRTIISQLTQRELDFEVIPTQFDDATIQAAGLAESIVRSVQKAHDWEDLREAAAHATITGGTAAIAVDWDASRQESIETLLSISEFVVEPGARKAEKARWWIKAQVLPPREVQATFGLSKVPDADATAGMDPFQTHHVHPRTGYETPALTLVLTYYERPNALCPDGRWCVVVNGKTIQHGEWAFPWSDRLNFAIVRETVLETQWAGRTVLDDVRSVQTAYNAVWSNLLEHLRDAGNNRLLVPSSASDLIREVTDIPGEMLEYPDGTEAPKWLEPPQLPGWLRQMEEELRAAIDDIMGVHDISRGQAPANIESGYGISILAEKDSSPVTKIIKDLASAFSKVASMVLALNEKYVTKERSIRVQSPSGAVVASWKGRDIAGQTEVRVPLDAIMPRSRAAQMQFAKDALQMGLIESLDQFSRLAELPQGEQIIAAVNPNVAKARRENNAMANERVQVPATFDDHEIHMREHNDFRLSLRYEQLTEENQRAVDDHVRAHQRMLEGEIAEQEAIGPMPTAESPVPPPTPEMLLGGPGGGAPPLPPEMPMPEMPVEEPEMVDPNQMVEQMLNGLDVQP